MTEREITGKHVLIGTVAAFGVIIAVNVTMAVNAIGTFPGLETKNSYVASQSFEARRDAQEALGWQVDARVTEGRLTVRLEGEHGRPVPVDTLAGMIGRPTVARDDQTLNLQYENGLWAAPVDLAPGAWVLKLATETADGVAFTKRIDIWVR